MFPTNRPLLSSGALNAQPAGQAAVPSVEASKSHVWDVSVAVPVQLADLNDAWPPRYRGVIAPTGCGKRSHGLVEAPSTNRYTLKYSETLSPEPLRPPHAVVWSPLQDDEHIDGSAGWKASGALLPQLRFVKNQLFGIFPQ